MTAPILLVWDGNNALVKAHFAMGRYGENGSFETLRTSDGRESGAVYGAINNFISVVKLVRPSHCLWTFDSGRSTHRLAIRPEYKANRNANLEGSSGKFLTKGSDFHTAFDGFKDFLNIIGVRYVQEKGVEADDLISSSTKFETEAGICIVSQDHDLLQLVKGNVVVYKSSNIKGVPDKVLGPSDVFDKYGCWPSELPKLWALTGDAGDNVVGIYRVGEKTALKMLQEYNFDLNAVAYNHPKVTKVGATDLVLENYRLIKLDRTTAKFDVTLNECEFNPDTNSDLLMDWLIDWEMSSLVAKLANGSLWA